MAEVITSSINRDLLDWLRTKAQLEALTRRANELRDKIEAFAGANGRTDAQGNVVLDLPDALMFDGRTYFAVKRERRVVRTPSVERVRELAERTGTVERLFPMQPKLNVEVLYVLHREGVVTRRDIEAVHDVKVSFGFKPLSR